MLRLKNITKVYQTGDTTVEALKGISVNFRSSEFVAILGQSGCGKTTTLNIIGGLDHYTDGDLIIRGRSTREYKARDWDTYRNQSIGFVFQSYNLIMHLTVLKNVELALTISGYSQKVKKQMAVDALKKVGLGDQLGKKPSQMSGGQMQRVAIARAIVNNPDIILADEPTGALDSATSVQIMDILREVAHDRLVVMVTHNAALADSYATRIVTLSDGELTGDTNPLSDEDEAVELSEAKIEAEANAALAAEDAPAAAKRKFSSKPRNARSSMSLWTSLSLSARNLTTKKMRTALTTFAGSIGIIGIALVLALSNGFGVYIDDLEKNTLSSYPLTVSSFAVDFNFSLDAGVSNDTAKKFPSTDEIYPYEPETGNGYINMHMNVITEDYVDYVKQLQTEHPDWVNSVAFSRDVAMRLLTDSGSGAEHDYSLLNTYSNGNWWQELLSDNFVQSEYDVLAGHYPQNSHELVLICDSKNQLSIRMLTRLGYTPKYNPSAATKYDAMKFDDFIGKQFKLLTNDQFYLDANNDGLFGWLDEDDYAEVYNDPDTTTLSISGIVRIKKDSDLSLLSSGVGYLPSLTDEVLASAATSKVVAAQRGNYNSVYDGKPYQLNFSTIDSMVSTLGIDFNTYLPLLKTMGLVKNDYVLPENAVLSNVYEAMVENGKTISDLLPLLSDFINPDAVMYYLNSSYYSFIKEIGLSTIPTSIDVYPSTFEHKGDIKAYLDGYNDRFDNATLHIKYTDFSSAITDAMSRTVDIVTYVLIAFAAISLIVSSVMISIITYISVLERTKEIGVLRSLGARKIDITNVFNAETGIIGSISGVLGVVIAAILTIPINAIVRKLVAQAPQTIAVLNPLHGVLLVLLSIVLTVLAGFIPALMAAKRDPVVALREN